MFNFSIYFYSLYAIIIFALAGWVLSLARDKVSHIDMMWSLFFLIAGSLMALYVYDINTRGKIVMSLLAIWSIRLSLHIGIRNGLEEDKRYLVMRQNNEPYFWLKSLYLVFLLQALLAWVICLSLFGAIDGNTPIQALDYAATAIVLIGLYWEVVSDYQLTQFMQHPENKEKVLRSGLWRYSRHPNYFGECCIWWGFFLFALSNQAWWAVISPILVTVLLLKVTGVRLLESTIINRRHDYQDYIRTTNALIPGIPKE